MNISISYNPATLADFLAAVEAVKGIGGAPVSITPIMPPIPGINPGGNRPETALARYYSQKTGKRFRIRDAEASAVGWQGETRECPLDLWEAAIVERLVAIGESREILEMMKGQGSNQQSINQEIDLPAESAPLPDGATDADFA